MKVIVLGGTGYMGRKVVKEICGFEEIGQIGVAGRNLKKCQKIINKIPDPNKKLKPVIFNVGCSRELSEYLKEYDIAAGTVGPFYRYERKIAEAAINAGCDYISLCDDYDAAEEVFQLDEKARDKGVRIVTGMGWTPGISSLLVRIAADSLDKTTKINVAWAGNTSDAIGVAVILHVIHIFSGNVPLFMSGKQKMVPAGSGRARIRFPHPLGEINVYNVAHPELFTMPKYFPGIEEVTLKGGINEDFLNRLSVLINKSRISRIEKGRNFLAAFFQKTLPFWRRISGVREEVSGIRVDVFGSYGGEKRHLSYSVVGPMEVLTGVTLAIGVRLLAQKKILQVGVMPPEALGITQARFVFDVMKNKGVEVTREQH